MAAAVAEASRRFGLPVTWIRAVIEAESGGRADAVSVAGAMGLMQLMPATWRELRGSLGLGVDPFDLRDNVLAGSAYLRRMLDSYGEAGFLAAYNAGPSRYEAWRAGTRGLPSETHAYVAALSRRLGVPGLGREAALARADWRRSALFHSPDPAAAGPEPGPGEPADHRSANLFGVVRTSGRNP